MRQLQVGDVVYIRRGAPAGGTRAYVYKMLADFERGGEIDAHLITEKGDILGGWTPFEQSAYLAYLGRSPIGVFDFQSVISLEDAFRDGAFDGAFETDL